MGRLASVMAVPSLAKCFESIAQGSVDGIAILNTKTELVWSNTAFAKLALLVGDDHVERGVQKLYAHCMPGQRMPCSELVRVPLPHGDDLLIETRSETIDTASGQAVSWSMRRFTPSQPHQACLNGD